MSSLKDQLHAIDETYLVGIANKGLISRAQKEFENEELVKAISLSLSDSTLEALFGDGTTVTINSTLNNFECTCPARTICKHVVMAIMKAMQSHTAAEDRAESTTPSSPSFDYLLTHTQESLIKAHGKKAYDEALSRVLSGQAATIHQGPMLSIAMLEGAITVSFLPGNGLDEAICTCKTAKCLHRLEALFHYIQFKMGELNFTLTSSDNTVDMDIIPHALSFVEDIYRIGVFRLPTEYSGLCSQYATLCHGAGFAALERLFEACGRELALYNAKNAGFNINTLARRLGAIYQICSNLLMGQDTAALGFKQKYMGLPKIHILGLGASPWYAQSGFCGVTAVFYCPEIKDCLTYALTRPVDSEDQGLKFIKQFWNDKSTWGLNISLAELARGEFALTGAKISDGGRLSSSEGTKGTIVSPHTDLNSPELAELVVDDFSQIKRLFGNEDSVYAVLKPAKVDAGRFDQITQEYKLPIYDKYDNCLHLTVGYSKVNESVLHHCETMAQKQLQPDAITVRLSISREHFRLLVQPIAFWVNGEIKNLGAAPQSAKDKKRHSYFAKFFNTP